jgi:HlyD family secretion protein
MDRPIVKKRWTNKRIVLLAFVCLLAVLLFYGYKSSNQSRLNVMTERIAISTVSRGPFQEFIPINGNVLPLKTIYLVAMDGGRVERKFLEAGTLVKVGEQILQLSNSNLLPEVMTREAQVFEQNSNLRRARLEAKQQQLVANRELAELDYEIHKQKRICQRDEELKKANLISMQLYEQHQDQYEFLLKRRELMLGTQKQEAVLRQNQVAQLEESVKLLQQNLAIARQKLENLVIRAPLAGQLTALDAEVGESKTAGQRLGQIDALNGFKVRAAVDEHYLIRVNIGQKATYERSEDYVGTGKQQETDGKRTASGPARSITRDASQGSSLLSAADSVHDQLPGAGSPLVVRKIFPEVKEGKFQVDLEFAGEAPRDIRRGQTLRMRLELGSSAESVLLPRGAFYRKTGGQWVYVVDATGKSAVKRPIELGMQNPEVFEVLQGLTPGEKVITSSYDNYGDIDMLVLRR